MISKQKSKDTVSPSMRQKWSKEEDKSLLELVKKQNKPNWAEISIKLSKKFGRKLNGKQCRERYKNYVNPSISKCEWLLQEKILLIIMYKRFGNRWSKLAAYLKKRSELAIKNTFHEIARKYLKLAKSLHIKSKYVENLGKIFVLYETLELIKNQYFSENSDFNQEKLITDIINQLDISEKLIQDYQKKIISEIVDKIRSSHLSPHIFVDIAKIGISEEIAKDIVAYETSHQISSIYQIVNIQYTFNSLPMQFERNMQSPQTMHNIELLHTIPSPLNYSPLINSSYFALQNQIYYQPMPIISRFCPSNYNSIWPASQNQSIEPECKKRKLNNQDL